MRTILVWDGAKPRFDRADPTEISEIDFETFIIPVLQHLYPTCHVFSFKPTIYYESEGWKPDLAIVDKQWCHWFVVEVEVATHSLQKHVLPQVRAFSGGDYRAEATAAMATGLGISYGEAGTIINFVPRYVAVISNKEDEIWDKSLAAENVQHLSISEYLTGGNPPKALLISGALQAAEMCIGFGTVFASLQAIRLPNHPFWKDGTYRLTEDSGSATWLCSIINNEVWLTKKRGIIQIKDNAVVQIISQDDQLAVRVLTPF